jgi:probable selenium-dependent hydroxylase accessory protein YqeC
MWHFQTIDLAGCLAGFKYIAFVGAGGKTSLCEYLGRAAVARGQRALLTTTTKIRVEEPYITLADARSAEAAGHMLLHAGKTAENGKLTGLDETEIEALGRGYDLVLIEADGAKGLPLKYPAEHEPVIPSLSDHVVVVAGLDALGATVGEKVFRHHLFVEAGGPASETAVTPDIFLRLFGKDALMKGVDPGRCTVVLNKFDASGDHGQAWGLAKDLATRVGCRDVVLSAVKHGVFYHVRKQK